MAGPEIKATGEVKQPTPGSTEVLHQRQKIPMNPVRMAIVGLAVAATCGYFALYSNKKPEASALDVAKVTIGAANPGNTKPRN